MENEKALVNILGGGLNKKPGGKPARTDNRRQKMDRILRKEKY